MALLPFLPFPIQQITIYSNKLKLTRWYWGLIPVTIMFSKEPGKKTMMAIEECEVDPDPIESGTFLDIILLLYPWKKVKVKYLLIYLRGERRVEKSIKLTSEEFNIISNFSVLIQPNPESEGKAAIVPTDDFSSIR